MTRRSCRKTLVYSGFTLLELMVATAISLVIIVMIVKIVGILLEQTSRSVGAISTDQEASLIRQYLFDDLEGIYRYSDATGTLWLKKPGEGWGAENWASVPSDRKPTLVNISENAVPASSISGERWGKEGAQISWIVNDSSTNPNDPGGLKAVAYQIKRMKTSASSFPRYFLMRSVVSAKHTLDSGYGFESSDYTQGSFSDSAFWTSSVIRFPNEHHIIASNVIDFGIRAFMWDSQVFEWKMVFPRSGDALISGGTPQLWVVMVRILTDKGAEMIENIEQGRMVADWWEVALEYSDVISFRVNTI